MSTARLLVDRRFWPLFWVQFLTAFNDNVLKMGLVLLVTYGEDLFGRPVTVATLGAGPLNALGGLLLMLPFFLFSALAGQLADRHPKHRVMRAVKLAEVILMALAAGGFLLAAVGLPGPAGAALLVLVFLMGTQSALFGPVKYSLLPQILPEPGELVAGNALVETGTYLAVLLGTIVATGLFIGPRLLGGPPTAGLWVVGGGVLLFALLGWLAALASPAVPPEAPDLRIRWEPVSTTWRATRALLQQPELRFPALANSWFWALGASTLALLPTWTAGTLGADETTLTVFTALFSVGIGAGSLLCARWSRGHIELGLVTAGALGLTLFLVDLAAAGSPWASLPDEGRRSLQALLSTPTGWRIVVDLTLLAASGGLFMVPLYAVLQERAEVGSRARVIGGLNIVNAAFMVGALAVVTGLLAAGVPERWIFLGLGVINAGWLVAAYASLPAPTLRLLAEILANLGYRLRVHGRQHLPEEGPALVISNHVSFVDWLIVMATVRRPHRFVIWHAFADLPVIRTLTRHYEVIPITNDPRERRRILEAFRRISENLREGRVVVVFPEGALPYSPELQPFMRGLDVILRKDPVPVIPMALNGLWGSMYSRRGGAAFRSWRPPRRPVHVTFGPPLDPGQHSVEELRAAVEALWKQRPDLP